MDRAKVEADVQARLGAGYQIGQAEAGAELLAALNLGEVAFDIFGLLALAMSGFIILNTFRPGELPHAECGMRNAET